MSQFQTSKDPDPLPTAKSILCRDLTGILSERTETGTVAAVITYLEDQKQNISFSHIKHMQKKVLPKIRPTSFNRKRGVRLTSDEFSNSSLFPSQILTLKEQ